MIQVYIYNTHDSFFSRLGGMILILGWRLETHNSNFSIVWCRLENYLQGSSLVAARPDKGTSFDCYSVWAPIHWHFSRPMPYYMFLSYITLLWLMLVSDKYVTCWVLAILDAYEVKRLLSEQIGSRIYRGGPQLYSPFCFKNYLQKLSCKKNSSLIVLMAPSPWKRIEAAEIFMLSTFATPIGPRQNSSRFTQQKRRFSFFYATHRFGKTVILLAQTMSRFE